MPTIVQKVEQIDQKMREGWIRSEKRERDLEARLDELERPRVVSGLTTEELGTRIKLSEERIEAIKKERVDSLLVGPAFLMMAAILVVLAFSFVDQRKSLNALAAAITQQNASVTGHAVDSRVIVTPAIAAPPGDGKIHSLELTLSAPCWIRVVEQTPESKVIVEGFRLIKWNRGFDFDEKTTVEVRSGCPGQVTYIVNGLLTSPPNESTKPKDSEVVHLTL